MWKLPDGTIISSPRAITINGVQYPDTIFKNWTLSELNAVGIYPFREEGYDSYFYRSTGHTDTIVDGEVVRTHTLVDSMSLLELQNLVVEDIKTTANSLLAPTDWYVIRNSEVAGTIPSEVSTYRASVRTASNDIETAVSGYTTYAELVAYVTGTMNSDWPDYLE